MLGATAVAIAAWQIYEHAASGPTQVATEPPTKHVRIPPDAALAAAPADAVQIAAAPAEPPVSPHPAGSAAPPAGSAAGSAVAAPSGAAPGSASGTPATGTPAAAPARTASPTPATPTGEGQVTAPPAAGSAASDSLAIASTPPGARVYLDGADSGVTPLKLPASPDRHTMALLLAGHELYIAQVDGHGAFQVPLKEVTPTSGPAGIKVLRCKDKDRYYVFVDGKPTGQTCPTERIGCDVGQHTVEVYDVVSETRRKWDVVVKDTRLSFRIRVE
jgi:hypothetical protein